MRSLSEAYQQKKRSAKSGMNHLASLESARIAQNQNIANTRRSQKTSGAMQGAMLGMQAGGPIGATIGGIAGFLLG